MCKLEVTKKERNSPCTNKKYDIVLCQKDGSTGISIQEIQKMYTYLNADQSIPLEICAKEHECSAIGFITNEAYSNLEYDLCSLADFIASIMDDINMETADDSYEHKGVSILMRYEF